MSKSPPTPPDYTAAAEKTGEANQQTIEQQTVANRPDVYTPFGSQTWQMVPQYDPVSGKTVSTWAQTTQLTPESQKALDAQQRITGEQSGLAESLLGQETEQERTPIDFSKMLQIGAAPGSGDQYQKAGADAAFKSWQEYNAPLMEQAKSQMDTQLRNQGLNPGDEAYDKAMTNLQTQQDAATRQATYGAVEEGSTMGQAQHAMDLANAQYTATASEAQMAEEMQKRGFTLNQIQAILSGGQVGMPTMPGFATAGAAPGTNYLGAATSQGEAANQAFSAQQAGQAGTMQGVGELAIAAVLF